MATTWDSKRCSGAGLLLSIAGCGGGGGSQSVPSAAIEVTAPGPVALTDAGNLVLRGTTANPFGFTSLAIAGNGVVSFDSFRTWSLDLRLEPGDVALTLDATDGRGRRQLGSLGLVRATPLVLHAPTDVVVHGEIAFTLDLAEHAIVALDLVKGTARSLCDPLRGAGDPLASPFSFDVDPKDETAWVVDLPDRVVQVDLDTGDRKVFSDGAHGSGITLLGAQAVVDDARRGHVLIVDRSRDAIIAADENTGDRVVFSDATHGTGPAFEDPFDAALVDGKASLFVVDADLRAVVAVSLVNGNRKVLSDDTHGNGPGLQFPTALALSTDSRSLFVLDRGDGTILSVDLGSGDRTLVSDGQTAGPPLLDGTRNVAAIDLGGETVLIADDRTPELVAVPVRSGVRELVQPWRIGSGPAFENPVGIVLDRAGRRLFAADVDSVKVVDLATGVRTELSAVAGGPGPALQQAFSIARNPRNGGLFVLDFEQGILAIDPASGARVLISDPVGALGLDFAGLGLDFDPLTDRLYFSGTSAGATSLFALDVVTRTITVVSDATHGRGSAFSGISSLSLTDDGATLLVVDEGDGSVRLVDTDGGDRTTVARFDDSLAPKLTSVFAGAIAGDGSFAVVDAVTDSGGLSDPSLVFIDLRNGNSRGVVCSDFGATHQGPFFRATSAVALDAGRFTAYLSEDDALAIFAIDLETGTRVVVNR